MIARLNLIKRESAGYNLKYLFRHSNRPSLKGVVDTLSVGLTEEGVQRAFLLGENLPWAIGAVCTSVSSRCVKTVEEIARGSKTPQIEVIQSQTLTTPAITENSLTIEQHCFPFNLKTVVYLLAKGNTLPGIYPIHVTAEKILDYVFSTGGDSNKVDLFCSHDFNIALLIQYLYPFMNTQEMVIENWPAPLEGVFIWGERRSFYSYWKGKISHHLL